MGNLASLTVFNAIFVIISVAVTFWATQYIFLRVLLHCVAGLISYRR